MDELIKKEKLTNEEPISTKFQLVRAHNLTICYRKKLERKLLFKNFVITLLKKLWIRKTTLTML